MRTILLSFLASLVFLPALAKDDLGEKSVSPFYIYESTVNPSLIQYQCQVEIHFNYGGDTAVTGRRVYMSINGVLEDIIINGTNPVTFDLTPGKYLFKIWGGPGYQEIISDSIQFNPQTVNKAWARMETAMEPVMVYKPVIYFHTDRELAVNVGVDPVGEFTFTYPEIGNGWNGMLKTDGSFVSGGKTYPYLFWESNQQYSYKPTDNGFKVERDDVIAFLESKCGELGFNTRETADFITFWGPKLSEHESLFIKFTIDEANNQFAELTVFPQPDAVKRVYIQFTEWSEVMETYLQDKTFEPIANDGFTVLEWGGFSFTLPEMAFNK